MTLSHKMRCMRKIIKKESYRDFKEMVENKSFKARKKY